jgi:hypothetical protein
VLAEANTHCISSAEEKHLSEQAERDGDTSKEAAGASSAGEIDREAAHPKTHISFAAG